MPASATVGLVKLGAVMFYCPLLRQPWPHQVACGLLMDPLVVRAPMPALRVPNIRFRCPIPVPLLLLGRQPQRQPRLAGFPFLSLPRPMRWAVLFYRLALAPFYLAALQLLPLEPRRLAQRLLARDLHLLVRPPLQA